MGFSYISGDSVTTGDSTAEIDAECIARNRARELDEQARVLEEIAQTLCGKSNEGEAAAEAEQARARAGEAQQLATSILRELNNAQRDPLSGKLRISSSWLRTIDNEFCKLRQTIEVEKRQVEQVRHEVAETSHLAVLKAVLAEPVRQAAPLVADVSGIVKTIAPKIPESISVVITPPQEVDWIVRGRSVFCQAVEQVEVWHYRAKEAVPLYAQASQWVTETKQTIVTNAKALGEGVAHLASEGWQATQKAYDKAAHAATQTAKEWKQEASITLANTMNDAKKLHQRYIAAPLEKAGQWAVTLPGKAMDSLREAKETMVAMLPSFGVKDGEKSSIRERSPTTDRPVREVSPTVFQRIRELADSAFNPVRKSVPNSSEPIRKPHTAPQPEGLLDRTRKAAAALVVATSSPVTAQEIGKLSVPPVGETLHLLSNIVSP